MSNQPEEDLHIRRIMDEGTILVVSLAKGEIGEGPRHVACHPRVQDDPGPQRTSPHGPDLL